MSFSTKERSGEFERSEVTDLEGDQVLVRLVKALWSMVDGELKEARSEFDAGEYDDDDDDGDDDDEGGDDDDDDDDDDDVGKSDDDDDDDNGGKSDDDDD